MKPASVSLQTRPNNQQRDLLSLTNSAVQALTDTKLKDRQIKLVESSSLDQSSSELILSSCSSNDQKAVQKLGTELNFSSSSSESKDALDSSFNTSSAIRVRVPSRLLREIKPPVNQNGSHGNSAETVIQPTPKIIRHANGPSAWVTTSTSSPLKLPERSTSAHDEEPVSTTTVLKHEILQTNEECIKQYAKEGQDMIGLSQGNHATGPLFKQDGRRDSVKAKLFSLSQRERNLKDEFIKRQDRKSAPIKRSVQPTIIATRQKQEQSDKKTQEVSLEDHVANAAAIAAAAASAATAPFLNVDARLRKIEELQQKFLINHSSLQKLVADGVVHQSILNTDSTNYYQGHSSLPQQNAINLNLPPGHHGPMLQGAQSTGYNQGPTLQSSHSNLTQGHHGPILQGAQSTGYNQGPSLQSSHSNLMQGHDGPILQGAHLTGPMIPNTYAVNTRTNPTSYRRHVENELHKKTVDNPLEKSHPALHKQQSYSSGYQPTTNGYHQIATIQRGDVSVQTSPMATQTESVYTQQMQPRPYVPAKLLTKNDSAVVNTKTQTSSQDTSLSSSDSPLQTPLPRKKPPRPTPHSNSKGIPSRKKKVHFDSMDAYYDPVLGYSRYTPNHYSDRTRSRKTHINHAASSVSSIAPLRPVFQTKVVEPSPSSMEHIMDELGRMRSDICSVLTELEQKFSLQDVGASLLDTYLAKKPKTTSEPIKSFLPTTSVVDPCADVKEILREVEIQRSNLEHNLQAVVRQSEEDKLYAVVDSLVQGPEGAEYSRVRQNIDNMIKNMSAAIKKEIAVEEQKSKSEEPAKLDTTKQSRFQPGKKIPGKKSSFTGKQTRVGPGKENSYQIGKERRQKISGAVKPDSKPVTKPAPKPVSSSAKQTYLKSVYGRQPHHAHRTTSKAPYLHYQSPVNPRTAALTASILGTGSRPTKEPIIEKQGKGPWYYFHPEIDRSQIIPSGDGRVHVHAPLEGTKMPMAIPLGKPRTDPSLRLHLPTKTSNEDQAVDSATLLPQSTPIQPSPKPSPSKPNVAVIKMKHDGPEEEILSKKKKTIKKEVKNKKKDLAIQILPQMDVDTLTESSETTPRFDSTLLDDSRPVTRPADIEYEDFRNYLAVKDNQHELEVDENEDATPRIPTPENPLTIQGQSERDRLYHGPPFPPQHPPLPANMPSNTLGADQRVSGAIEDRALEWVEQELLARIVSEMNQPLPDPTLTAKQPDPSPDSSSLSDDDGDALGSTIGLGGLQLFVDAGIPVDRDLVAELIKDVIAEQIVSTLGYPKPVATPREPQVDSHPSPQTPERAPSPLETPIPTPVYTPAESESSGTRSMVVSTPDPTPTPSEMSVTMETEEEEEPTPIKEVKELEKTEPAEEVSIATSPVATPVATPTGHQTPTASITTPEQSTREDDITDVGLPVETPEPSVEIESTKSTTPAVSPTTEETSKSLSPPTPPPPVIPSPAQPSPPTNTTSTLSPDTTSNMTTIDEELSEGQLIQPYVHAGKYSEGEYAVSPGLVDLVKQRNEMPTDGVDLLGKDEESRNELIRIALHGLLRRGMYSSSSHNTTSTLSTLRDADDIRQDSMEEYSHSEGEVIFPRDPVPVRYAPATSNRARPSPGELTPTVLRSNQPSSPGELDSVSGNRRVHPSLSKGRVIDVKPGSVDVPISRDDSDSRSLHKSDLQQRKWTQSSPGRSPRNSHPSGGSERTLSRGSDRIRSRSPARVSDRSPSRSRDQSPSGSRVRSPNKDDRSPSRGRERSVSRGRERPPIMDNDRSPSKGSDGDDDDHDRKQPAFRPTIHVPIPSMELDDTSDIYTGDVPGYDPGDTSIDISSISGGDF